MLSWARAYALARPENPNYVTPGLNVPARVNDPLEGVIAFTGAVLLHFASAEAGTLIDFGIASSY